MEPYNKGDKMVFTKYLLYLKSFITPLDVFKSNHLINTRIIGFKEIKYNIFF